MKAKAGDEIEFLAISWDEPQWEFDHPTVVLSPVIRYSPNGTSPETMMEDLVIDMDCSDDVEDEDISEEFNWRGWKISTLRKVCRERLAGKDTWKSKIREVLWWKVKFYEEDGELSGKVIEEREA